MIDELPFETKSLLDILIAEIKKLFQPLLNVVEEPRSLDRLLSEIGASASTAGGDTLVNALSAIVALEAKLEALSNAESPSFQEIAAVLDASDKAFNAIRALDSAGGASAALEGFSRDLISLLVVAYLNGWHPIVRAISVLLTLIEPAEEQTLQPAIVEGEIVKRLPYIVDRFHLDRVSDLLHDPVETLRKEYIQNDLRTVEDANATAAKLFPRLAGLLRLLGVSCRYGINPGDESLLGDPDGLLRHALIIYAHDELLEADAEAGVEVDAEAGVVLMFSPADRGDLGIVVCPFGKLTVKGSVLDWKTELSVTGDVQTVAYGRHGVTLLASLATTEVAGRFTATLEEPEDGPAFTLGSPTGTRLEIGGAEFKAETKLSEASQALAVGASVSSSQLVIAPGDADSFLAGFLPKEGLQAKFDLGLEWSNKRGLTFRGAAGLDATIPLGLSIRDVLSIPTAHLGLLAKDGRITGEISVSLALTVGPIVAVADRIGIKTLVTFPEDGGNLGVADLALGFKPPTGVGISINNAFVSGGGFLFFDFDKGEYGGVLELSIQNRIRVNAIGLISTRLPSGAKGFSFVIIITAEGFQPLQLGLGFTLTGIGGLLAINRTFSEDVLRSGLTNHTLDSVMFPKDPTRNAPQIISNLNKVFPPASGHHLFGPMVQISWGTPALITANVALIVEFGARRRLLMLGQVLAVLPKPENDLVRLHMDALGIIDFDQGTAALDATLHDSRLLHKFVLTGDMAMRMQWKSSQNFALAIGGFHHAFKPPPNFPKLKRISINLCSGNNPRFRCEAYFAVTSNSVQFGARAELYAEAHGFNIQGGVGFDVLIQFDPFYFIAEFDAHLQLRHHSTNLFSVRVKGALSGPRPLHLKAKASFSIFWWDISIPVNVTLVQGEKPPLPEAVDVMPRLKEALNNRGNWVSQLPDRQQEVVTLGPNPWAANDVLLHPLGTLTIKQNVVPLNFDISRFGQGPPAGDRHFTIGVTTQGFAPSRDPVKDFFAPAQFIEMTDDEKLSRPSFELMDAGLTIGSTKFDVTNNSDDWLEVEAIKFETKILDPELKVSVAADPVGPSGKRIFYELSRDLLVKQARFGAAANSATRRGGDATYRTAVRKYKLAREGWTVVETENMTVQAVPGIDANKPATYSQIDQGLRKLKEQDPAKAARLKILRPSDLSR
jgi:hypothetical protein